MLRQPAHRTSKSQHPRCGADDDLPSLMGLGITARFARNTMIFNQGDEAKYAYKVVMGAVRHSKFLLDGRRQITDFTLPGEFFGFEGDEEYGLTAEALTDVDVICYPRSSIERLADDTAGLREKFISELCDKLLYTRQHLVMLGRQTAKERIAAFLVAMIDRKGSDKFMVVDLPMGRQDIADYLGLTIETVCREISELKQSGIIDVPSRRKISIRHLQALRAIAQGA